MTLSHITLNLRQIDLFGGGGAKRRLALESVKERTVNLRLEALEPGRFYERLGQRFA